MQQNHYPIWVYQAPEGCSRNREELLGAKPDNNGQVLVHEQYWFLFRQGKRG